MGFETFPQAPSEEERPPEEEIRRREPPEQEASAPDAAKEAEPASDENGPDRRRPEAEEKKEIQNREGGRETERTPESPPAGLVPSPELLENAAELVAQEEAEGEDPEVARAAALEALGGDGTTPEGKARAERVNSILEEETRKLLPEKLAKARRGLRQLYDLLPHDRNPKEREVSDLLDHTELEELLPAWRRKLAEKIRWENLAQKPLAEFITGGMEVLYAWAYIEAMKDASGPTLERLRNDREDGTS